MKYNFTYLDFSQLVKNNVPKEKIKSTINKKIDDKF